MVVRKRKARNNCKKQQRWKPLLAQCDANKKTPRPLTGWFFIWIYFYLNNCGSTIKKVCSYTTDGSLKRTKWLFLLYHYSTRHKSPEWPGSWKERTNTFQHLVTRGVLLLYHKKSHPRSLEWLWEKFRCEWASLLYYFDSE